MVLIRLQPSTRLAAQVQKLPLSYLRNYTAGTVKINADRLNKTLHETCEWGADHRYGP